MSAKRILLVDDEDDIRLVASVCLQRVGGYEVEQASSGEAALAALSGGAFDAVVLDMQMPGMDGRDTLAAIRSGASAPDVPVVFLTASVQQAEIRELEQLPVHGLIPKPFDPMRLAGQLTAMLGWDAGAS